MVAVVVGGGGGREKKRRGGRSRQRKGLARVGEKVKSLESWGILFNDWKE